MGRSNADPLLGMSAGARLTVTRWSGNSWPELTSAALTRSRLSFTSSLGKADRGEGGQPGREIDLDIHRQCANADDRRGSNAGEHGSQSGTRRP